MNLDPDLQRILNVNAKVYHTASKRQGKVISVSSDLVIVDYGNKARPDTEEYDIDDFSQMLVTDEIVANSRLTMDSKDNFKIKPRVKSAQPVNMTQGVKTMQDKPSEPQAVAFTRDGQPVYFDESGNVKIQPEVNQSLEVGYINFTTGNFTTEPKKGYTKVEFRKVIEEVTLRLTSEQVETLRELGIVK